MNEWLKAPRGGGLLATGTVIVLLPLLFPNNYYYHVAVWVGLNAIVCIGLNLLIGYAGQISLGHAGFLGLGAYASAILTARYGWPPLLAMLAGVVAVGAVALAVARPILRLRGHYLAMATLGMGIIISIIVNTEDELTGGPDGMPVVPLSLFGIEFYSERIWYWIVGVLLLFSLWLALNLIASPVGRALRSIHGSEVAAQVSGIDTAHYKVLVFVISAVFASVVGSLGAHFEGYITSADVSFFRSIELVTMVVLGGMASTYGALVGAAILTVLPQVLTGLEEYEHMAYGLILMLTVIFMPKGLVPTIAAVVRDRLGSRAEARQP